jgi:transcriptional regulator with XRE-family HTH domain
MPKTILLKTTAQFSRWATDNRDRYKISQRKLLKLAGLSHATLTNVSENTDMRLSTAAQIARVFGYQLALIEIPLDDTQQKSPATDGGADTVSVDGASSAVAGG